mgnify:CR=1 FL=1
MLEHRQASRKPPNHTIPVTNAITGELIGCIGNLSISGMMLVANQSIPSDALFQFAFHLPDEHGQRCVLELGVHEQWGEVAQTPGQYWAGFRIISIGPQDFNILYQWVNGAEKF